MGAAKETDHGKRAAITDLVVRRGDGPAAARTVSGTIAELLEDDRI